MKRIVLFRFHKEPDICENHLQLARKINPGIPVFGLYGGEEADIAAFNNLKPYLEDFFPVKGKSREWKWKNGDLAVRLWFDAVGAKIDFDMLHLIEWDLLLFDPLENAYREIPRSGIGLTGLIDLARVENKWDWTMKKERRAEWDNLLEFAGKEYGYKGKPYASLGPGSCLPKSFLAAYCAAAVPELGHDELRLPLFGQLLGFKLYDTGFYRRWFDAEEHAYFNCCGHPVDVATISGELQKASGRRVFHPFRALINI